MSTTDIGIIGLGVMGSNLAHNLRDKGSRLSVYKRTAAVTTEFITAHGQGRAITLLAQSYGAPPNSDFFPYVDNQAASAGFRRELGLWDTTVVVAGASIGIGICVSPAHGGRGLAGPGWVLVG